MLVLWWRLRGRDLHAMATAEVRRTAAAQGVELLQFVAEKVPQGRAANRAAEAGQQQVATGGDCWREMERVDRAVPRCLHDGGEPGFLRGIEEKIHFLTGSYNSGCTNTTSNRTSFKIPLFI